MSFVSTFTYSKMNTNLEMLSAREQLIEDIEAIVEGQSYYSNTSDEYLLNVRAEDLISVLCDAVCKNFPTN